MENKDIAILKVLMENSRLSFREVAKKNRISVVTVINRVKELEKQKIIKRYVPELDYEKLGYEIQVIIQLRVSSGKLFEVERTIAKLPNVFAVYDITGDFDSMILAKFRNRKSLDSFLKKIQTYDFIERTETKLILNIIKENFMELN